MYIVPDNTINIVFKGHPFCIKQKIIPDNTKADKDICSYIKFGQFVKPQQLLSGNGVVKGITVHNTPDVSCNSDTSQAEQYTRATYNGNMKGVVVHYYISQNEIWQLLDNSEQGWHASDGVSRRQGHDDNLIGGNLDTIAIECIGDNLQTEYTAAIFIAYLLNKFNLKTSDVYSHNYWMYGKDQIVCNASKNCPLYILPHWNDFICKINKILESEDKNMFRVEINVNDKLQAEAIADDMNKKGYSALILMGYVCDKVISEPVLNVCENRKKSSITVGALVKVKSGAKSFEGAKIAQFVYNNTYKVDQLKNDRAVLDLKGLCTAFNVSDLILV